MSKDERTQAHLEGVDIEAITKRVEAAAAEIKAGRPMLRVLPEIGWFIYPFFLLHMFLFGMTGFWLAYSSARPDLGFLYMHGGIAIVVYLAFYLKFFGRDDVTWMLINACLGVVGIYSQMGWILERFDRRIDDYPWYVHVVPFLYYVLYTFLLRQIVLDVTRSRRAPLRRRWVEAGYVVVSLGVYGVMLWRG